jgi:hypothetical protein
MLNKIYLIVLAAAAAAMSVLLYLPYSWLQSISAPSNVTENYLYYANISWIFLLISSIALLVLGNLVFWKTRKGWAMWISLVYFTVFMVAHTFWIENSFFRYRQANNIETGIISWSPLFGVVLITLAAIIVFFNQYLVKRMHDKMYIKEQPVESLSETSAIDRENI